MSRKVGYRNAKDLLDPDAPTPARTGVERNYRHDTYRWGWGGGYLKQLENGRFQADHWYGLAEPGDTVVFSLRSGEGEEWQDWRAVIVDVAWSSDPRDLWYAILEQLPEDEGRGV